MSTLDPVYADLLRRGVVIPAHPLALTPDRTLDVRRQVALTRYYCAAGVGGIAVGVHTTQFEIHAPETGLLPRVLALWAPRPLAPGSATRRVLRWLQGQAG